MSSYSASAAKSRGSVVPPLSGVDSPSINNVPESCDILICGTGITESILAAALAWQGSNVLHIDKNGYYGDSSAILNVDQLKEWVDSVNKNTDRNSSFEKAMLYIPRPLQRRDYLIDLTPKIMFAKSDLLELLIKSRVSRYLEFKALGSFHTYEKDSFEKVAGSKGDIFSDQSLTLLTKRVLMKFIKFVLEWENEQEVWQDYQDEPIDKFLSEKFKLERPQIMELVLTIGLCGGEDDLKTKTPKALSRIKRYLISFDVYGSFPVLYSMYGGAGEISQGFCRSAAVAGATYKLDTALSAYNEDSKVAVLSDGSKIQVQEKLVISPTNTNTTIAPKDNKKITRMVAIVGKSCQEWFAENESAAVVVFPPGTLANGSNKHSVQAIIYGWGSGQVPQDQAIWYLSTVEQDSQRARNDLEEALKNLESNILRESQEDFEIDADVNDVSYRDGMPVVSSVKLGQSMQNFVPKEKLQFLLKLCYTQKVGKNMVDNDSESTIFSHRPSGEISFDGIIEEARHLYEKITGSDDDFFDVDFEDEQEEDSTSRPGQVGLDDHGDHAADEMEL